MRQNFVVKVDNVSKKFSKKLSLSLKYGLKDSLNCAFTNKRTDVERLRPGEFWSLKNVSFQLGKGDRLGVLGGNGAGKSTLMKVASGLLVPDGGSVQRYGTMDQIIEITGGFHPLMSGFPLTVFVLQSTIFVNLFTH